MSHSENFFPDSERVLYLQSPLSEVICQLRFPPILRVESQIPADFQDRVRAQFPLFEQQQGGGLDKLPKEVRSLIGAAVAQPVVYSFGSEDGASLLTLSRDSLALTSRNYRRWEDFRDLISQAISALVELYQPAHFTRVGLRYRNFVFPEKVGFAAGEWHKLLGPALRGELAADFGGAVVEEARRVLRLRSTGSDSEGILLQHGIANDQEFGEASYLIDVDVYTDRKVTTNEPLSILARFNYHAGRAFRWSISNELHEALGPQQHSHTPE
ncbi:TIGR04255 family protein [Chelatococcus reniformis]|uniref:TIGR04255 family protein n=1 Tax=Chelatococcus reniformis TaxID=1494448 RepID=A0A916UD90_9HYPH|nr:TIGR04255 family protein [Chelatococcus reniformis]GGC68766.1 hypothetical protein GCM10010994_29190 [Chelatococcus reniformis]